MIIQAVRFEELHSRVRARTWYRFKSSRLERRWISGSLLSPEIASLITHSRLLYYQGALVDWFARGWSPEARERDFPVDARGFGATTLGLDDAIRRGRIDASAPVYTETYDEQDFLVGLGALRQSARLARGAGSEFLMVNMPEQCDRFLAAPDGLERYRSYLGALTRLAEREGVRFIDITGGDPSTWCDHRWFSDYHHFSPAGARRFTVELGKAVAAVGRPVGG